MTSKSVLDQIEQQSEYAFPQLMAYMRLHEGAYEVRIEFLKHPVRAAV